MNFKRNFCCIFLVFLLPFSVLSQDISIMGTVKDIDKNPVYFANMVLFSAKDSSAIKGTSTNEQGFFELKNIKEGNYFIKISFIGFKDFDKSIQVSSKDINLGEITLHENNEALDEVNIVVNKPTIKKEADRLVFGVENTALSEGSLLQVVKSTPGVLVMDGQIMVKGSSPTVYINNRKVQLSSDELFQLLEGSPANAIKSVEVITNPSASYDAESGVVLNIIMSKNLVIGYRGSVFANYTQGVFPRYNFGMTNYFKTDKINLFANYSYTDEKINRDNDDGVFYLDSNNQIENIWRSSVNRNTWTKSHNLNFNLDFLLDEKNTLSVSSNMLWTPYFKYKIDNNTSVFDANNVFQSRFEADNLSNDDKYNLGFDLDYVHKFSNSSLAFNSHFTIYDYNRFQESSSNYYDQNNNFVEPTAFNTDSNQETQIFTAQLDYKHSINETSNFDVGSKYSNITTESDITRYDYDFNTNQQILNTANSSAFHYKENVFAAYANYDKVWDKWSINAGLRMEQTNVKGVSITNNQTDKRNYLDWFPTASIKYQAGDVLSFYTNFKRSIERPSYTDLNPFTFFLSDNTLVVGNPNLNPTYKDHYVIGSTVTSFLTLEAYYIYKKDNILELPFQDNINEQIVYSPFNVDKSVEFGFDFISYFNITDRWFVYAVTSFYNSKEETNTPNGFIKADKWTNYSVLSNDFTFLEDHSLSVNFTLIYLSPNLHGFMEVAGVLDSELSISKTILKKRAVISLSAADLFNSGDYDTTTQYLNQRNYYNTNMDNRYVKLGFRYKFGNTKLQTNERQKEVKERERIKERD
ncbi:TonB-dependent receptor domain-containing protein [Xanthomarina sp. F2636L]|uniref:TonB-dependent receptor domain-containing protein n=1 Tax=Xanthomarina sp. F2636L TaxID=2996018 RepID=UPI00225E5211|nr:outer membrane beta-barrel family protein [Xanthomarina sp. F2636L]MCX7551273.1 outer membrane beta-barrel family protein [Xanthomarina sp. F2636L]